MAKKKLSHLSKQTNGEEAHIHRELEADHQSGAVAMDVSAENETLRNLKLLNNVLVKETSECRKKVEALVMEKMALETELNRWGLEKEAVRMELTSANDHIFALELEKRIIFAFMETRIGELSAGLGELVREKDEVEEMKREKDMVVGILRKKVKDFRDTIANERVEIRKVVRERDAVKSELHDVSERGIELRKKLNGMENTERIMVEEIEKLRLYCKRVEAKDEEHKTALDEMRAELALVKWQLTETKEMIANLESKNQEIAKEKENIELVKVGLELVVEELQGNIKQLNSTLMSLTGEKKVLVSKIWELEKYFDEALKNKSDMVMEINKLAGELKEEKATIQMLIDKHDSLEQNLNLTREQSKVAADKIENLILEKKEMEEEKAKREIMILELQRKLGKLNIDLVTLEDKYRVEEEKSKQLITKVNHSSSALGRMILEKENAENGLNSERMEAEKLILKLSDMEKRVEESERDLKQMRREQEDQLKTRKKMETQVEVLEKDKGSAEKKLSEAHIIIDELKEKIKSAGTNAEIALTMVKKTVKLVCNSKQTEEEEMEINGQKPENEIIPFVAELNAIKKAFKNKEKMAEEMKIQLEAWQAKYQKRKSFFTLLTTATTIFALLSAVYVTRGR